MENLVEYFMRRNQSLMAMLKELHDNGEEPQVVMDIAMEVITSEALDGNRDN